MSCPKLSIITPSLNHARFLRNMIQTILNQSFKDWELIVVDGGSTDETIDILKEYPQIRWISEKDESFLEAVRKAFALSRGQYIVQCLTSDGFVSNEWLERCANTLDADPEISLVWGHSLQMAENGENQIVAHPEFFEDPPPQKTDYLTFWLATAYLVPENNFCVRRNVFDECFPKLEAENTSARVNPYLEFNYNFHTKGYLPYFLSIIASHGRDHTGNRTERLYDLQSKLADQYYRDVKKYRKDLSSGKAKHLFRDGSGNPLREISTQERRKLRQKVLQQQIRRSRFLRTDLYSFAKKISARLVRT